VGLELIVFAQTPVLRQPRQRALHHPAFGQDNKALLVIKFLDNRALPLVKVGGNGLKTSRIRAIGLQWLQAFTHGVQKRKQRHRPVPVLPARCRDLQRPYQAQRIYTDRAFAAFDLLSGVKADRFFRFGRPPFSVVLTD